MCGSCAVTVRDYRVWYPDSTDAAHVGAAKLGKDRVVTVPTVDRDVAEPRRCCSATGRQAGDVIYLRRTGWQ